MAKDFRAKQLRTSQVIISGSSVGTIPSLLIYSSSAATDVDGNYNSGLLTSVGTDVWMFISGSKATLSGSVAGDHRVRDSGAAQVVLFGGDVVVSGTLFAERQVIEVDRAVTDHLILSGASVFENNKTEANTNLGYTALNPVIGSGGAAIFAATGSIFVRGTTNGTAFSEIKFIEPRAGKGLSYRDPIAPSNPTSGQAIGNHQHSTWDGTGILHGTRTFDIDLDRLDDGQSTNDAAAFASVAGSGIPTFAGTSPVTPDPDDVIAISDNGAEKKVRIHQLESVFLRSAEDDIMYGHFTMNDTKDIKTSAAGGSDLGTTGAPWGDIFVNDGKKVQFGASQDVTFGYDGSDNELDIDATTAVVNIKSTGASDNATKLRFIADAGADAKDGWEIKNEGSGGSLKFINDSNAAGTYDHTILTVTGHNTETSSVVEAAGILKSDSAEIGGGFASTGVDIQSDGDIHTSGKIGVGLNDPDVPIEVMKTTTQQKWSYDADSFATITVADASHTTVATGETGNLRLDAAGNIELNADGGTVTFKDDAEALMTLTDVGLTFDDATTIETTAGDLNIKATGNDADIKFTVDDNGADRLAFSIDGGALASTIVSPLDGGYLSVDDSGTDGSAKIYGDGTMWLYKGSDTASDGCILHMSRSRTVSSGTPAISLELNDTIGQIDFLGQDVSGQRESARIRAVADGDHGNDGTDTPGRLEFYTTADDADTATERMVIKNDGKVGIGTSTPNQKLDVATGIRITDPGAASNYMDFAISGGNIIASGSGTINNLRIDSGFEFNPDKDSNKNFIINDQHNYATVFSDSSTGVITMGVRTVIGTPASCIITLADGTFSTNGQVLSLTMYGDAANEVHDITFSGSSSVGASSVSFTNDGDNTYSATIGVQGAPTDAQVALALATLLNSHSGYSATSDQKGGGQPSTVTITAVVRHPTSHNIAQNTNSVSGLTVGSIVGGSSDAGGYDSTPSNAELVTQFGGSAKHQIGTDTHIFISGSASSRSESGEFGRGVTVFAGDVLMSGSLYTTSGAVIKQSIAENGTFAPNASGTKSVAIGDEAVASNTHSFAMGHKAKASGAKSVAIGSHDSADNVIATHTGATALGFRAQATADYAAALGGQFNRASGTHSIAMGQSSQATGADAVAIGKSLTAGANEYHIGDNTTANADIYLQADSIHVPNKIVHKGDADTYLQFVNDDQFEMKVGNWSFIKVVENGAGSSYININDQAERIDTIIKSDTKQTAVKVDGTKNAVFILSGSDVVPHPSELVDPSAGEDVAFFVSGSFGSSSRHVNNLTAVRATSLFGGDILISGSVSFKKAEQYIKSDGSALRFKDGANPEKTLSDLLTSTSHGGGIAFANMANGYNNAKMRSTGSLVITPATSPALGDGTNPYYAGESQNGGTGTHRSGIGEDVMVALGGPGARAETATNKTTVLAVGDFITSGSTHLLGRAIIDNVAVGSYGANPGTGKIAISGITDHQNNTLAQLASGKFSFGAAVDANLSPVTIHNNSNTTTGTSNEFQHFGLALKNNSTTQNAFAGIAFDVSSESDADSISAAIRAIRSEAGTAANHTARLSFATNNNQGGNADVALTEQMVILSDGKVGIGTNAPGTMLQLKGAEPYFTLQNETNEHTSGGAETKIIFEDHSNAALSEILVAHEGASDDTKGNLKLRVNNGSGLQDAITIQNTGNVVIDADLTVAGNDIRGSGGVSITMDGSNNVAIAGDLTVNGNDIKDSGGNTVLSFDGSGNVDVLGTITYADTVFADVTVSGGDLRFGNGQNANIDIADTAHNVAGKALIVEAGNTTAGTTNNINGGDLFFKGGRGKGQGQGGSIVFETATADANAGSGLNSLTEKMRLSQSGLFGIGTNNPSAKLHVKGRFQIEDSNSTDILAKIHESGDDGIFDVYQNNSVTARIHSNGDSYFTGGSVGIGTSSPGTLLQLEAADAYLTLKNTSAENGEGGAETRIIFEDHSNTALAQIEASHKGTADDTKGKFKVSTHNGTALTEALLINEVQKATFSGDLDAQSGTFTSLKATSTLWTTAKLVVGASDEAVGNIVVDNTNGGEIIFEGATANAHETALRVIDPSGDNVISLPDETGTVLTTASTTSALTTVGTITTGTWNAGSVTASGLITANANLSIYNGASGHGSIRIFEDSDNGAHSTTITAQAFSGDRTLTIPDETGTILTTASTASALTSVGTITTGTWEGTDVAVAHGGTGASSAADAQTNLGLAIGSDVQAYDADLANLAGCQAGASAALAALTSTEVGILDGALVTTTELNNLDGGTAASATTVASADRVVYNDNGTMKQVSVADLMKHVSPWSTQWGASLSLNDPTEGYFRMLFGNMTDGAGGDSSAYGVAAGDGDSDNIHDTDGWMSSTSDEGDDAFGRMHVCGDNLTVVGFRITWIGEDYPRLQPGTTYSSVNNNRAQIILAKKSRTTDYNDTGFGDFDFVNGASAGSDNVLQIKSFAQEQSAFGDQPYNTSVQFNFDTAQDFNAGDAIILGMRIYFDDGDNTGFVYRHNQNGSAEPLMTGIVKCRVTLIGFYR